MRSLIVKEEGLKLVDFISLSFGISKKSAKDIVDSKLVFVNSKRVWIAKHILKKGDVVEYFGEKKENLDFEIIYEDEFIIAVNKPPFVLSNEGKNSLEELLRTKKQNYKIKAIHRLDKETSGVILFAKNELSFEKFKELWKKKEVKKTYLAICYGETSFKERWINEKIDGKPATSLVRLIKSNRGVSYFEVEILTGRKHQIREHLASIRHPIIGDKLNDNFYLGIKGFKNVRRQLLHSYKIEFVCPFSGETKRFFAPIPEDFKEFLGGLK
ncbi:MAG: RluA family pseudouridine synthase [Brevinematales bacterium]|nr:RluA family pseudouridine synthase [Brevinematales bacterium]